MKQKLSYDKVMIFLFLSGVIAGTVLSNLLSSELMKQSGYFGTLFAAGSAASWKQRKQLFFYILRQRAVEVIAGWVASMSVYSGFIFAGLSFLFGGIAGITISIITYQKGVWGLFYYLATVFPQGLCYLPAWFVLTVWAGQQQKGKRFLSIIKLLMLVVAGVFLEAYINPSIIHNLLNN